MTTQPVRLRRPRSRSRRSGSSFSCSCTILRSTAVIGSSSTALPLARPARRSAVGERLERRPTAVAVPGRVDDDRLRSLVASAAEDRVGEVLDRVDRLAVLADQHAELGAVAASRTLLVVLHDVDPALDAERVADSLEELAQRRRSLALVASARRARRGRSASSTRRDHARRRVADAEQAALALGDDLEANRRLVEARVQALELAQRRPLRLADGLARRLDRDARSVTRGARRFFFRLTCARLRRGGFGAGFGRRLRLGRRLPSTSALFGGVRELVFGGGCGFGTSRRVIRPCPTVHRFVVTQ